MKVEDLHVACQALAERLKGTPVEEDMQAIVDDIEWAKKKVYIRKPEGKERLNTIAEAATTLESVLDEAGGWGDEAQASFEDLDDSVRRLRIEIARDTQTAT